MCNRPENGRLLCWCGLERKVLAALSFLSVLSGGSTIRLDTAPE